MTYSPENIDHAALRAAKHDFHAGWDRARNQILDYMIVADIPETDEEAHMDASEERWHCPTCVLNGVLERLEPVLLRYTTALEITLGIDPEDRA